MSVTVLLALSLLALDRFAAWAEGRGAYSYKSEDWLRYMVSSSFEPTDRPRLDVMGSSTVREAFVIEALEHSFPRYEVRQGGISLGTLDDVRVLLEYLDRSYGPHALPDVMILGVSARFLAELPKQRPLEFGIDEYAPRFAVDSTSSGRELTGKSRWEGLASMARFRLRKQTPRYRAAIFEAAKLFAPSGSGLQVQLQDRTSPYRYRQHDPMPVPTIERLISREGGWWPLLHRWDPTPDWDSVVERGRQLTDFTDEKEIQLFLVNLPERSLVRDRYDPDNYEEYRALLRQAFPQVPLLDLRLALSDDQFYDAVHANADGARRVTDLVTDFVRDHVKPES